MDFTRGLITRLVDDGGLNEVKREGITEEFLDEDFILVWNYINKHYSAYKDTPSRDAVLKAFPNFEFGTYKEPLSYFVAGLKESYRRNIIENQLEKVATVYNRDTTKAELYLREALKELQVTQQSFKDVNLALDALERYELYEKRKSEPPEDGILSNWASLDYQTLGWHPEEFIVLVGEKYIGKSWLMVWLAYQALLQKERVLFITKEMAQNAITRRFDSIFASVKFDSLKRGELSNVEEKRYKERMEELNNSPYHFIVAREGVATIEDIKQKAIEVDATCVFVDSVYLFPADGKANFVSETNRRLEISRACKGVARDLSVPLIVSVQAGRKKGASRAPDLDDIEWSNAFSQDADTVFFKHKDEIDVEINRAQIHLLKSRDGNRARFYIDTDYDYMQFKQREDSIEPSTDIKFDDEEEESVFARQK